MTQRVDPLRDDFHREVEKWAKKIQVKPKRVQIQRMTRKWASWSSSGRICFSSDLLKESKPFREVVIVHELVHCLVPNHGKLFKSLMRAYLPQWEARKPRKDGQGMGCSVGKETALSKEDQNGRCNNSLARRRRRTGES